MAITAYPASNRTQLCSAALSDCCPCAFRRPTAADCALWQPPGGAEANAVEAKYAASYSASVDPFAAWRARAAEERRASMGMHDR